MYSHAAVRASRWAALLMALTLVATSCFSDGGSEVAVPTPEREPAELLPPTPRGDDEIGTDAAAGSVDAQATPIPPTPTPRPPTLSCLSERTRHAQLLLPLGTQSELSGALALATSGELGGIALLGSPDEGLAPLLAELQNESFVPILVASDEEGGDVQRLAGLLGPLPSAAESATTSTPEDVRATWLEYGSRVKALGIDVVLGPVVDVGAAPGIGSRSFSDDPAVVTTYAAAVADGLADAGVMAVFKHFPGHGRASLDSHLGLPLVPTLEELWASDLLPYVDLVGDHRRDEAAVMIGHLSVPGFTGDLPTSLSPETINGLLKNEIGFDGLVFTDAMNMGAIVENFGTLDAIVRSFRAGADIAILGSFADVVPVLDHLAVEAAADPGFAALLDQRVERVLAAKGQSAICVGAQ